MKNFKKVLAVVMALTLIVTCFAACGGEKKPTGDSTTLKIGMIGPLTGGAAGYGIAVKNGIQLAVDEINAAGGICGMQIEFNPQDDEHNAEKSVNAYNKLKDWGMQVLIGTVTSTPCIAVQAEAGRDNLFMITPSGSAVDSIAAKCAFRVCFADPDQGAASAKYIAEKGLATKIAVFYNSSDAYSTGIKESFEAVAKEKGLEIVTAQSFTDDNKSDFNTQISAIKSSGAELVFAPIYTEPAALLLQQAKQQGLTAKIFGCDGFDGILNVENFDATLADGAMLLTPYSQYSTDEISKKFTEAYLAKYPQDTLNQFAADAYDAVYIVKAAAEKAQLTAGMDASAISDALQVAMTEITFDGVTGRGMKWSANGEPARQPIAFEIKDGRYVEIEQ
ncbi:MAG: ABC transporter substrate-binding protein [Candidatus Fimenecus sp.]